LHFIINTKHDPFSDEALQVFHRHPLFPAAKIIICSKPSIMTMKQSLQNKNKANVQMK